MTVLQAGVCLGERHMPSGEIFNVTHYPPGNTSNSGLNTRLATVVVQANPGSVMGFYWGNPGNVRSRIPYVPYSFKAAPLAKFPSLTRNFSAIVAA